MKRHPHQSAWDRGQGVYYRYWHGVLIGSYETFVWHAQLALAGRAPAPSIRAPSRLPKRDVIIYCGMDLLAEIDTNPERFQKSFEVLLKYGFRGFSRGGKTGLFLVRKQDAGLVNALDSPNDEWLQDAENLLAVPVNCWGSLKRVKVVWHEPSGERLIGVMSNSHEVLLVGFSQY